MTTKQIVEILIKKAGESEKSLESFVLNLNSYFEKRGERKIWKKIISDLKSLRIKGYNNAVVISGKELSQKIKSNIESNYGTFISGRNILYKIDENLISGYRIDTTEKRVDKTHKNQLLELYHVIKP